jgi:hypothetical protein
MAAIEVSMYDRKWCLIWSQARPGFVSLGSFFLDRKSYMHPR